MDYEDCEHKWNSGDDIRVCLKCGQVRTFPTGEDAPVVLWVSRGDDRDPTALPKQWKSAIAHLAKTFGPSKFIELTGLPLSAIRGWIGAYCRQVKAKQPKVDPPAVPSVTQPEVEPVIIKRKYDMTQRLAKSPKSPKSPLSTPVAKSDHKVDLPPFPPFSNDWDPSVQMEWISVYSGLAKGSK